MTGTELSSFDSATQEALAFLHHCIEFDLWMVTEVKGNDWIVLKAHDRSYGVEEGALLRWSDTFCSRMVMGQGPRMAPCASEIAVYRDAPIAKQFNIAAYIGVPLTYADGTLFGTLCAIHPTPKPEAIATKLPLVEIIAKLLSSLLEANLKIGRQVKHIQQTEKEASKDALTGLYNRRGWNQRLAEEENRCQRHGGPACVIAIDLDGLKQINDRRGHAEGDRALYRAGQAIQSAVRQHDVVARVGGDEFVVLLTEYSVSAGQELLKRLNKSLVAHQIEASFGIAVRTKQGLLQAWERADQAMYRQKRRKKLRRIFKRLMA